MAKNFRIYISIPESLKIAVKESTKVNCKTFDELIIDLCNKIKRPKDFQGNYSPIHTGDKFERMDFRVSEDARIKFLTFSAVFKNSYHVLDYLIYSEQSSRMGHATFS